MRLLRRLGSLPATEVAKISRWLKTFRDPISSREKVTPSPLHICSSILWSIFVCCGTASGYGLADHVTVHGNNLDGYNANGVLAWRYRSMGPLQVYTRSDGNYVLNGKELVGRDGRLLQRLIGTGPSGLQSRPQLFDANAEIWSPAQALLPNSAYFLPPVTDPSGDVWTAVYDALNLNAHVMKSEGSSGVWSDVETLPPDFGISGTISVDTLGNVTLACLCVSGNTVNVQAVRYEPQSGWSPVQTLFSETDPGGYGVAENISVASDADGNAVVVSDIVEYGAAYFVYSATTHAWSALLSVPLVEPPNPLGAPIIWMPKLSRSPNGEYLVFSYAVGSGSGPAVGLYTNSFDSASLSFGPPILVTPTANAANYYVNADTPIMTTIDNEGAIEVLWQDVAHPYHETTKASRFEKGKWKTVVLSKTLLGLDEFEFEAINTKGDILFNTEVLSEDYQTDEIDVYHFSASSNKWTMNLAASWPQGPQTRARVAWLGDTGQAVLVFMMNPALVTEYHALSSAIWNGSTWLAYSPVPPDNVVSMLQEVSTSVNGDVVLLYDPSTPTNSVSSTYGTFMLP